MDDFSPEFISRLASRIYNEQPQTNGHAANGHGAPHMPESPAPPAGMQSFIGSVPVSVTSMPHMTPVASVPGVGGLSDLPGGMPAAPTGAPSMPGMHNLPHVPTFPGFGSMPSTSSFPVSMPSTMPENAEAPGFASASAPDGSTSAGLSAFVQKLRRTHYLGEEYPGTSHAKSSRGPESQVLPSHGPRPFDINSIREDFPILRQKIHGKPLAWLDNAATTQKPQSVIDAISNFYTTDYSNIHRGAHTLAARATDAYEKARQKVQSFLGAPNIKDIVFVRGTTEGINLVANAFGRKFLQPGDEIVLSQLEHHANIVPWQMVAKEKGANLRVIPVNDRGEIMMEEYQKLLGPRTRIVSLTHASNSLGTILPVAEMTQIAKRYGARVLIDGAQSVAHIPVNVQELGADFYVFSGHKIFGPTGIGALYIREELHDILPPWQGGGSMIRNVTFEESSYADPPAKWEAGTPNIADAVGLGAALDYVNRLGLPNIAAYEHKLLEYATERLSSIGGLRLIGTAREKVGVLSFVLPNKSTQDIGRYLDQEGIAVRSGHHCAQPSLRRFGLETTVRPSLAFYNTCSEIDRLVDAIKRIQRTP